MRSADISAECFPWNPSKPRSVTKTLQAEKATPKMVEKMRCRSQTLLPNLDQLPALKDAEKLLIAEALKRSDGNQTIAAQLLGMSRQALHNRLSRARRSMAE